MRSFLSRLRCLVLGCFPIREAHVAGRYWFAQCARCGEWRVYEEKGERDAE